MNIACKKTAAIWAPTDNMIASSIETIGAIASKNNSPLFVCDNLLVKKGALAAKGINFQKCGKQAAKIAIDVLINNKKPSKITPKKQIKNKIVINKKILKKLKITLPKELNSNNCIEKL